MGYLGKMWPAVALCSFCKGNHLRALKNPALGCNAIIWGCSKCDSVFLREANGCIYDPPIRILGSFEDYEKSESKN